MNINLSLNIKQFDNKKTIGISVIIVLILILILTPIYFIFNYQINSLKNTIYIEKVQNQIMSVNEDIETYEKRMEQLNLRKRNFDKRLIAPNIFVVSYTIDEHISLDSLLFDNNRVEISGQSRLKGSIFNMVIGLNEVKFIENITLENFEKNETDDIYSFNLKYDLKEELGFKEEVQYNGFIQKI